jgi:hypothetical protein
LEQFDDTVPGLDLGASVALVANSADLTALLEGSGDSQRLEVAMAMLDDFQVIDQVTGWPRSGMASLLGCRHPDPSAWLSVDLGELMHSQTVVHLIRDVADAAWSHDTDARVQSLRTLAPTASTAEVLAIARREMARSAVRLCKDLLRRSRGSAYAVKRVLADGSIMDLIASDLPGDALLLGNDRLSERSQVSSLIESRLGNLALNDPSEDPVSASLDEATAELRAGLRLPK